MIGIAIPVIAYFWFLEHFALNVIFRDQWSDIYMVNHDWLGNLWAQHDVQRIFFPNLVVVALATYTHLNVVLEEFVSAGCLVAAGALLVLSHRRWAPKTPWLFYVPLVAVLFSLNQVQDTLWGFQLAWYMVLLSLALTIYLVDAAALVVPRRAGHGRGLRREPLVTDGLVHMAGLLAPSPAAPQARSLRLGLVGGAVITAAIYFHGFAFTESESGNDNSYTLQHPLVAVKYLVFSLGGSVGAPASPHWLPFLLGTVLLATSVWAVALYGFRRDEATGRSVGVALVVFGLLFAAATPLGRAWAGLFYASRYNTFYLLLLAGCYLAFFERPDVRVGESGLEKGPTSTRLGRRPKPVIALVVVALLVCVEVVSSPQQGIDEARTMEGVAGPGRGDHTAHQPGVGFDDQRRAALSGDITFVLAHARLGSGCSAPEPLRDRSSGRCLHVAREHPLGEANAERSAPRSGPPGGRLERHRTYGVDIPALRRCARAPGNHCSWHHFAVRVGCVVGLHDGPRRVLHVAGGRS